MANMPRPSESPPKTRRIATRLAVALAGGSMALSVAGGVAWADEPTLDAAVNTTCTYPQVLGAINAESPEVSAKFNGSPVAQGWLQKFLDAPRSKRQKMLTKAEKRTEATPGSMAILARILSTCTNY